jgi:hypothetical protein
VANYSPDRIVFHIENAEDDVVALVSYPMSLHLLLRLTITSSYSSSVSISIEESNSFVLTILDLSQLAN